MTSLFFHYNQDVDYMVVTVFNCSSHSHNLLKIICCCSANLSAECWYIKNSNIKARKFKHRLDEEVLPNLALYLRCCTLNKNARDLSFKCHIYCRYWMHGIWRFVNHKKGHFSITLASNGEISGETDCSLPVNLFSFSQYLTKQFIHNSAKHYSIRLRPRQYVKKFTGVSER